MSVSEKDEKTALDHAWRYFDLHAGQRMSLFNYYLALSGLVLAGIAGTYDKASLHVVGILLGIALATVAYIFWKLDQRVSFMLKRAELALGKLECALQLPARLFHSEPEHTKQACSANGIWTYGKSFRIVFLLTGSVGLSLSVLQIAWWALTHWNGRIH